MVGKNNRKVKLNLSKLSDVESLKRSFFKEAILNGWAFSEKSKIFNLCKGHSDDFDDLLSVLSPFIDPTTSNYFEPAPIRASECEIELDFMAENSEYFIYQFSMTYEMLLSINIINPSLYFNCEV